MKWILGVTAIAVIVGLAATLTVPAQTITPNEAILKLFPPETQGIGFVDVAGLRGAPLFNDLILQKLPQLPPEVSRVSRRRRASTSSRTWISVTAGHVGPQDMLIIVEARYDPVQGGAVPERQGR